MEPVKVIIRDADGKLIKGYTNDFSPNKPQSSMSVLLIPARLTGVSTCRSVSLRRFFFVKDFAGNPEYHEKKEFSGSQQAVGRKMEVVFKGGEGTQVIATQFYRELFTSRNAGFGSTIAIILLIAVVPVMIYNLKQFREQEAF